MKPNWIHLLVLTHSGSLMSQSGVGHPSGMIYVVPKYSITLFSLAWQVLVPMTKIRVVASNANRCPYMIFFFFLSIFFSWIFASVTNSKTSEAGYQKFQKQIIEMKKNYVWNSPCVNFGFFCYLDFTSNQFLMFYSRS